MAAPLINGQKAANLQRATYFSWEEFDAFPRLIRDLMNYTPHAVGTGYVTLQLRMGVPVETAARQAHRRWARYAREETLALYGPDHPACQEPASAA